MLRARGLPDKCGSKTTLGMGRGTGEAAWQEMIGLESKINQMSPQRQQEIPCQHLLVRPSDLLLEVTSLKVFDLHLSVAAYERFSLATCLKERMKSLGHV
jgi:hypothetical protein